MNTTEVPEDNLIEAPATGETDENDPESRELFSQAFNVVVVPTSAPGPSQTFILSAMRRDRELRLVSPDWTEAEVRDAFARAGCSLLQTENLLRGNRMAYGGRRTNYLYFYETQLRRIGLGAEPAREPDPEPLEAVDIPA